VAATAADACDWVQQQQQIDWVQQHAPAHAEAHTMAGAVSSATACIAVTRLRWALCACNGSCRWWWGCAAACAGPLRVVWCVWCCHRLVQPHNGPATHSVRHQPHLCWVNLLKVLCDVQHALGHLVLVEVPARKAAPQRQAWGCCCGRGVAKHGLLLQRQAELAQQALAQGRHGAAEPCHLLLSDRACVVLLVGLLQRRYKRLRAAPMHWRCVVRQCRRRGRVNQSHSACPTSQV
jgi:hypothetical protein